LTCRLVFDPGVFLFGRKGKKSTKKRKKTKKTKKTKEDEEDDEDERKYGLLHCRDRVLVDLGRNNYSPRS
jgi:hypothetical protein